VPSSSPRIDPRLVAALSRLDRDRQPVAELHRKLGDVAQHLGLAQPSYESVRLLVRDLRKDRAVPGIGEVLLDIALRNKPPDAIIAYLSDHPHPKRAL
jgi:hypothetical protein